MPRRKLMNTRNDRVTSLRTTTTTTGHHISTSDDPVVVMSETASSIRSHHDDLEGQTEHHVVLTTCIAPYRTYVPSNENFFREPHGDVKIIFNNGGDGSFYKKTNGTYPGYDAELEFMFHFDLKGLGDGCKDCRIQINEGVSCESPLIRFWDRTVEGAYNPWRPEYGAVYTSNKDGTAKGSFSMFDGFDYNDHKRRSVVVYDQDSSVKIGCGNLRREELGACENAHNPDSTKSPSTAAPSTMAPASMVTDSPILVAPPASVPTDEPTAMPSIDAPYDMPHGTPTDRPHLKPNLPPSLLMPSYYPPAPTCAPEHIGKDKSKGSGKDGCKDDGKDSSKDDGKENIRSKAKVGKEGKAGKEGGSHKTDKRDRRRRL